GDFDALVAALTQILDNAYRYTPRSGHIHVSAGVLGSCLSISVQDTGPGIAAEDLPRAFETFWRRDVMHSTPGFGLGLPIAQRIITRHGGSLHIESQAGQGTTVRMQLPTSEESKAGA
ncbi:MAG: ATP-binding protein, partial [Anaerolineae bacterium]|nr:ATP-binding protein [Anaerolineae bacterium]